MFEGYVVDEDEVFAGLHEFLVVDAEEMGFCLADGLGISHENGDWAFVGLDKSYFDTDVCCTADGYED